MTNTLNKHLIYEILSVVEEIPPGKVASYGQIATLIGREKNARLPGTEDMDEEYRSNAGKHIRDGFIGMAIGLPVAAVCGLLVMLLRGAL